MRIYACMCANRHTHIRKIRVYNTRMHSLNSSELHCMFHFLVAISVIFTNLRIFCLSPGNNSLNIILLSLSQTSHGVQGIIAKIGPLILRYPAE